MRVCVRVTTRARASSIRLIESSKCSGGRPDARRPEWILLPVSYPRRGSCTPLSAKPFETLLVSGATPFGIFPGLRLAHQPDRAHDLARRTEAALESILLDERGLHRMQRVALGQAFDRQYFGRR